MPQENGAVLVVRVTDVLDQTRAGKAAAEALRARFVDGKKKREGIKDPVEAARFEIDFARDLEGERARQREALLVRARTAAEAIRKKKKAALVVDAGSVIAHAAELDITDAVIKAVDAQG